MIAVLALLSATGFSATSTSGLTRASRGQTVAIRLAVSEDALLALETAAASVAGSADAELTASQASRIFAVRSQLAALTAEPELEDEADELASTLEAGGSAPPFRRDFRSDHAAQRIATQADAWFDSIDENGDGIVSYDELAAHLQSQGFRDGAIEHIFDLLDVNRDGDISKAELQQSLVKYDDPAIRLALGLGATEADDLFDAIDDNGDGEITMAELAAYLELNATGGSDEAACAKTIFRALDANGDGSVSREELRQGYDEDMQFRKVLGLAR